MKLETFQDVLRSIEQNRSRPFHLMMGNGFSMAYDPKIFSYNALYDFVSALNDSYKANVGGSSPSAPTKILGRIPRTHSKFARKFCGSDPEHAVVPPPRARSWRLRRLRPARAGRAAATRNRVADDAVLGLKTRLAAWIKYPTSAAL